MRSPVLCIQMLLVGAKINNIYQLHTRISTWFASTYIYLHP